MKEFPSCNKACAICNEPRKHGGRIFCQSAHDALYDSGLRLVGMNIRELDGVKHVQVQPWDNCVRNCADFNVNENLAKEYLADGESPYTEGVFDWYFNNANYTR